MEHDMRAGSFFSFDKCSHPSKPQAPRKPRPVFFPKKLIRWASDPYLQCIEWLDVDGKPCIYITDKMGFAARCYNNKYNNFRRQLSEYGFQRMPLFRGHDENKNKAVFYHPAFFPGADIDNIRKEK